MFTCYRYSQEQVKEQEEQVPFTVKKPETEIENLNNQTMLSSKLEVIEQKLLKLQSLKDETISEFSSLLSESINTSYDLILFTLCST